MLRPFVALHEPGAARSESPGRLAAALAPPVRTASLGGLSAAWEERSKAPTGPMLCVLDGFVDNLEELGLERANDGGLVAGWRRWGTGLVERLRGDFALLLWDPQARRGVVARDHTGARAVYLREEGGRLLVASEQRYLLGALARTPGPDPDALAHWLGLGDLRGDRTLFAGVRRLPPGHLIEMGAGGWEMRRYWEPRFEGTLPVRREEAVVLVREALERAIDRRLPADRKTAIQLSGGLDSSAVAALAVRRPPDRAPAAGYSATFPSFPAMDEEDLIELLTRRIRLPSVRLRVHGGSVLRGALEYLRTWRLPLSSPNYHYQLPLFERMAADGVELVLDGEGGDELFGAVRYLMADRVRRGRIVATMKLARRYPGAGDDPPWPTVLRFARDAGVKGALPHALHRLLRRAGDQSRHVSPWLTAEAARRYRAADDRWAWKTVNGPRWWAYLSDLMTDFMDACGSFAHLNRRAAAAGLEARHPLRDVDLIQLVLSLPPELAFDPHRSRPLLRAGVAEVLPDELRLRPGKGVFEPLFHRGLLGDMPLIAELLGPDAHVYAYVDRDRAREGLLRGPEACPRGRYRWAEDLFRIVTAECWLRELDRPGYAAYLIREGRLASSEIDTVRRVPRPVAA